MITQKSRIAKPCPFCGTPAETSVRVCSGGEEAVIIYCSGLHCEVLPSINTDYQGIDEIYNKWNTRKG